MTKGRRGVLESAVGMELGGIKATRSSRSHTRAYVPLRSLKRASQMRAADPRALGRRTRALPARPSMEVRLGPACVTGARGAAACGRGSVWK